MSMITVAEAAENWGISVQLVRRFCRENRISDVCMEAQMRFEAQIALQGLLECHAQYQRMAKHNIE